MITTPQQRFILDNGDGSAVDRVFTFPVYDKSEVVVRRIDVDGILSAPLAEGVDYDIVLSDPPASGGPHPGGTITYHVAAIAGEKDYSYAQTPLKQNVKVTTTSTTYSLGLERNALDPIVFMIQELNDRIGRIAGVDNPAYGFPLLPDPVGNNGKVLYVADDAYTLVDIFDGSEIFLSNAAAGRLAMFSGADSFDGLPNVTYVDGTKTLKIKGSAVAADKSVQFLDSGDVVVGSFRSDGQIIDDTDLTTKLYVDVAISGAVPLSSGVRVLDRSNGLVPVENTVTETPLLSFTLPGGSLVKNRKVRVKSFGKYSAHAFSNTFTIKVKYGATTIFTKVFDPTGPQTDQPIAIEAEIRADNSASAQAAELRIVAGSETYAPISFGTAAIASGSDQTVAVTITWGSAYSDNTISMASEATLI